MDRFSIRFRLLVAAGIAIGLALAASGWGLERLFERHVERRAVEDLRTDLHALLGGLQVAGDGQLVVSRPLADQRYTQPLSGVYWQILRNGQPLEKSRSLWDEELSLPDDILPTGGYHEHKISGPTGQELLAVERAIAVTRGAKTYVFRATVAVDLQDQVLTVKAFRTDLIVGSSALGLALLVAFWMALSIGLAPLNLLRRDLAHLRSGKALRLTGTYPSEVQPIVGDLNELLKQQEMMLARAKARAGNLAHGLKTPLTAALVMAEELTGKGERELGEELQAHVATMQRHVEHELALARSAHGQACAPVIVLGEFVSRLVETMQRLPGGSGLNWAVDIGNSLSVRIDETTLGEIVGNLLDNARKWAHGNVLISATARGDCIRLDVFDDGPGIPEDEVDGIVLRGKRLDETRSGSGLGLSIAADIADQIGGRLEFSRSPLGGLGVHVDLPCSVSEPSGRMI